MLTGRTKRHDVSVAVLYVVAVDVEAARRVVKCFDGVLRLGDLVAVEDDPADTTEVQSIQLFQNVYVHELEPNFNALLHLARPVPARLRPHCRLVTRSGRRPVGDPGQISPRASVTRVND